jgi:hypothetical protein
MRTTLAGWLHSTGRRGQRARKTLVAEFLDSHNKPYEITADRESEPGKLRFWLTLREEPSDEISLAAGDAIHNARSALDHIVYELASRREPTPRHTGFPIHSRPKDWNRRDKRGRLALSSGKYLVRLLPKEARTIVKDLQPWQGYDMRYWPRERLRALHALDIADKHKNLNLAVAYLGLSPYGTYGNDPIPTAEVVHEGPLQLETPVLMLQLSHVPESKVHPIPMLEVTLSEGGARQEPIIGKLTDLIIGASTVVKRLQEFL